MCGYLGVLQIGKGKENENLIKDLPELELVRKRGPDQESYFSNSDLALFHSRLVVTSPPEEDVQPMVKSVDGREEILVFSGEIYNWKSLVPEAKGDTSALFKEFSNKTISCLSHLRGDFSFFFKKEKYFLVRDHLGVKPLYYSLQKIGNEKFLVFSTNLKAILGFLKKKGISPSINPIAEKQYLQFRYVLDPKQTIISEIFQVQPGSYFEFDSNFRTREKVYWEIPEKGKIHGNLEEFEEILKESIFLRVPEITEFGTFLSGGLDSGYLTAMTKDSSLFKGSFSLDVPGVENERERLNRFLENQKVLNFLHPLDLTDNIKEETLKALDIPIGDSVIYLLSNLFELSSKKAKVFLSGDGADELFGGYIHHKVFYYGNLFRKLFPGITKNLIFSLLNSLPISFFQSFFPYQGSLDHEGISKLINYLKSFSSPVEAYLNLVSLEKEEEGEVINHIKEIWPKWDKSDFSLKDLLSFDLKFWGPNYSLNKIDFLSGYFGIEVRVPYYDYKLVEWVLTHQCDFLNLRQDKILLRQIAKKANLEMWEEKKSPFRVEDSFINSELLQKSLMENKKTICRDVLTQWKKSLI